MKRLVSYTLLLIILLSACDTKTIPPSQTLIVFAAASLTDAFSEIGQAFEAANPGAAVTFNFAGSQALRTQVEEGAPADVFASADTKEMDALVVGGFITPDAPRIFLTNKLVVILPADNPARIASLEELAKPGIKLVLADEEVPVGKYARQALEQMNASFRAGFKSSVLANIVSNEDNVKQVIAKVQLGEADAGIVYASDTVAAPELQTIDIPAKLNVISIYPIAPLTNSTSTSLAEKFVEYVLSANGQAILKKWGFGPVP